MVARSTDLRFIGKYTRSLDILPGTRFLPPHLSVKIYSYTTWVNETNILEILASCNFCYFQSEDIGEFTDSEVHQPMELIRSLKLGQDST